MKGLLIIMSPTFGFLYGMILASLAIAYFSKDLFNKKIIKIALSVFVGALITFACGIIHLAGFIGIEKAVMAGLMPFIYSELLKIALAIFAVYLLIKKN